ncbi:hypothetical protein KDH_09750 [Dictyobacter sp. S3.2.2.5]|uniref:DUF5060 domain-containing protein n=1 Tax=Dictyobacter halimunensis TaxID=3026934 RepID=A0ABQ6FP04_9CHLR|nr:hypothetical protein KDH_09750 [Dictyobacter sp. S3.2.2.5]
MVNETASVEQWGIFEVTLHGPGEGNPFQDVELTAQFRYKHRAIEVDGFYDGDGTYRIRFMPDTQGEWMYRTQSNCAELRDVEGSFSCHAPDAGNHGPVRVAHTYHFAYADGTPYKQLGTTCYAWTHQGDELEEQTLATLSSAPFNKLRMCVFPKHYAFNENEPEFYPFPCLSRGSSKWQGKWDADVFEGWSFDFSRFDPAFFQHFEQRVADLMERGIEADIILFHPYDRWGFSTMSPELDDRYLRYIVARLSAYRNVWWSMANEYDLMRSKTMDDWDRFFRIVQERDPYQHLRSIHNCHGFYDHAKPWVTHQSIQHSDLAHTLTWREEYKKPVVVDECCYEGNIPYGWGNISGLEMVHRFWEGTAHGGYVGHGDTFLHPEDILWWAKGGVLHGECAPRLAFFRKVTGQSPAAGLDPIPDVLFMFSCVGQPHEYYLTYFGTHQPAQMTFRLPEGERYQGEVINIWDMTVTPLDEPVVRNAVVQLPGKPYHALVLRRAD